MGIVVEWVVARLQGRGNDIVAQLKALASLSVLLKQKSGKDIVPIIPQWAFEYKRLLQDYNWEVRQATHDTMTNLVIAVGFEPILIQTHDFWFPLFVMHCLEV
ncbi:hypothetical protein SO802_011099 [Lithocarpus litseifolius]|uniref:E3 ubiquitin-protein ligase listerin n=1 Tax=Lithocarpus litseifolius TaxID=425828 RepID=A0AAW2DGK5_9ROSI